jgi:hypothetical protein
VFRSNQTNVLSVGSGRTSTSITANRKVQNQTLSPRDYNVRPFSHRPQGQKENEKLNFEKVIIDERPSRTKNLMLQSEKTLQITKSLLLRKGRYLNMENSEVAQDQKPLNAQGEPTLTISSPKQINRCSAQNSTLFKEGKGGIKDSDEQSKRRFAATQQGTVNQLTQIVSDSVSF